MLRPHAGQLTGEFLCQSPGVPTARAHRLFDAVSDFTYVLYDLIRHILLYNPQCYIARLSGIAVVDMRGNINLLQI